MLDKIRKYIHIVCEVIELFFALLVGLALVVAVVRFVPEIGSYTAGYHGTDMFLEVLEEIFSLVVGIEFIKMLCKPNTDNVIEALVFLVARHMIIVTNSAIDNLFSIISVTIQTFSYLYMFVITKRYSSKFTPIQRRFCYR